MINTGPFAEENITKVARARIARASNIYDWKYIDIVINSIEVLTISYEEMR